jgi:hypothetical protein
MKKKELKGFLYIVFVRLIHRFSRRLVKHYDYVKEVIAFTNIFASTASGKTNAVKLFEDFDTANAKDIKALFRKSEYLKTKYEGTSDKDKIESLVNYLKEVDPLDRSATYLKISSEIVRKLSPFKLKEYQADLITMAFFSNLKIV